MDTKLAAYRQLLKKTFGAYNELLNQTPRKDWETVLILDDERDHYMLHTLGWKGTERVWNTPLYVRIANGKFQIEEDWLEQGITTDLLNAGVPNDDIVLAFHPPKMRPLTEFATM